VARSDTLHAKVARGVASKLEHLRAQILADGSHVDGRSRTDAAMASHTVLQVPVDTADGELATQGATVRENQRKRGPRRSAPGAQADQASGGGKRVKHPDGAADPGLL